MVCDGCGLFSCLRGTTLASINLISNLTSGGSGLTHVPVDPATLSVSDPEFLCSFWDQVTAIVTVGELPTVEASRTVVSRERFEEMCTKGEDLSTVKNIMVSYVPDTGDTKTSLAGIETRIVSKKAYQTVSRKKQREALHAASSLAADALALALTLRKGLPDRSTIWRAHDALQRCLYHQSGEFKEFKEDKQVYAEGLNALALLYLGGMPPSDGVNPAKEAITLFRKAVSLGDDAQGSASYHLAKCLFFSAFSPSLKNAEKRKQAVQACKAYMQVVLKLPKSPYLPGCRFYQQCLQASESFTKSLNYDVLRTWCTGQDGQNADYLYYYAKLIGRDTRLAGGKLSSIDEFTKLVEPGDYTLPEGHRKYKAHAYLGILHYEQDSFIQAIENLVAGFQSGVARIWGCLYNRVLLGGETKRHVLGTILKVYPENVMEDILDMPEEIDGDDNEHDVVYGCLIQVLFEAFHSTRTAVSQQDMSLVFSDGGRSRIVAKMYDIQVYMRNIQVDMRNIQFQIEEKSAFSVLVEKEAQKVDVKRYMARLESLLDRHEELIRGLDSDLAAIPAPTVSEIQEFLDGYRILMSDFEQRLSELEDEDKASLIDQHEYILPLRILMQLFHESTVLLGGIQNMQSAYQNMAICKFESHIGKKNFSSSPDLFKVKQGFFVEDSNRRNLSLNDHYKIEKGRKSLDRVGLPVVVKKARNYVSIKNRIKQDALRHEKHILETVLPDHPNIVRVVPSKKEKDTVVMRPAGINMVDFCRTLQNELRSRDSMVSSVEHAMNPEIIDQITRVLIQLLNAIQHVHEYGYAHGDIKLENIMIDASGRVRLMGFGHALRLGKKMRKCKRITFTEPFLLTPSATVTKRPDGWAIGQVLFEMLEKTVMDSMYPKFFENGGTFRDRVFSGWREGDDRHNEILYTEIQITVFRALDSALLEFCRRLQLSIDTTDKELAFLETESKQYAHRRNEDFTEYKEIIVIRRRTCEQLQKQIHVLHEVVKSLLKYDLRYYDTDFQGISIDGIFKQFSRYPDIAKVLDIYVERGQDGNVDEGSLGVELLGKMGMAPYTLPPNQNFL